MEGDGRLAAGIHIIVGENQGRIAAARGGRRESDGQVGAVATGNGEGSGRYHRVTGGVQAAHVDRTDRERLCARILYFYGVCYGGHTVRQGYVTEG